MSRIGGGGIPPKGTQATEQKADLKSKEGIQQFKQAAGKEVPQKVVDSFQRAGPALETKIQQLSSKALAAKLNFTNEDLAMLARVFNDILRKNPSADRLKRAKLFAKAILKKKKGKLAKLFDEDNEDYTEEDRQSLEEMFEIIAEQLDSTPVFAQLIDEVTESARKIR